MCHTISRLYAITWTATENSGHCLHQVYLKGVSEGEACGSKSIKAVACPLRPASTDKCVANVVLPVPPFCETMDKTFILPSMVLCRHTDISIYRHGDMRKSIGVGFRKVEGKVRT